MIKELRKEQFDIIFDLQGLIKSGIMARASGSNVYGFDQSQSPEWPNRWLVKPVPFHSDEKHVVQKYRHIAAAPFLNKKEQQALTYKAPRITTIPDIPNIPHEFSLTSKYTVMHVGGGWQTKQLPEDTWQKSIAGIEKTGNQCVLTWGNPHEKALADRLASQSQALALPRILNIFELTSLLQSAKVVIGGDTGILHLAAALNTSTITMWGPSAASNSAPLGNKHIQIETNPACGPCFKRSCDNFICLPSLHAEHIISAWQGIQ